MCKYKQAPESSLGAEVDNESPQAIYTHAGRVQCTYENSVSLIVSPPGSLVFSPNTFQSCSLGCPTLQVGLRWATDAVPP